jgi:riboflavin kinase / FMN adenylyltransferase
MRLKTYSSPDDLSGIQRPVISAGTFDGVHLGHRAIIRRLLELSAETGGESLIITFEPHPRIALNKDAGSLRLLNTSAEKAHLLEQAGIRHLVVMNFSASLAAMSGQDFIREILVKKLHVSYLVTGYNHRFGAGRSEDFHSLAALSSQLGFQAEQVGEQYSGDKSISSTQIRNELMHGNIAAANAMLGYEYFLSGKVVRGAGRGRTLGFPTANLRIENKQKLIPSPGAYAVRAEHGTALFTGMCNIGTNPTFAGKSQTVEVHLFDFSDDIYEQELKVYFSGRLRDEQAFPDAEALSAQLHRDAQNARNIFGK